MSYENLTVSVNRRNRRNVTKNVTAGNSLQLTWATIAEELKGKTLTRWQVVNAPLARSIMKSRDSWIGGLGVSFVLKTYNKDSEELYSRVIERKTGEVLLELPPTDMRKLATTLKENCGQGLNLFP